VRDVLALCYHAVSPAWPASLAVTPEALEDQARRLLDQGYRPATFTEATCDPPRGRTMVVTFDDAFASVHRYALPILRRLGVRATLFTPTRPIERAETLGWPGVSEWKGGPHEHELTPLSWREIDDLAEAGWEIGSHTESHPHLTRLSYRVLAEELEDSRQAIRRRLGACTSIAYPYGDVDDRVAGMASRAGYAAGAALGRWPGDRGSMRAPRVGIYRSDDRRRFAFKTSPTLRRAASVVRR
jgi:peptidoglycan/xylan/chitin deacetylase (PgdA/CDA1 family)